jgi:AcrR family transcriptional regulator
MRADAVRNADAVLQTAARLLWLDPNASIGTIATAAGVDRSTVYRRFSNRDSLILAIYAAKMQEADAAMDAARPETAAPLVALHRWVEGTIEVSRRWPVDLSSYRASPATAEHTARALARLERFIERAQAAGVVDPRLDTVWVRSLLTNATGLAAHELTELEAGPAADIVVRSLLAGVGPK